MNTTLALLASWRRHGNIGQLMKWFARELMIEVLDLASTRINVYENENRSRKDDFEALVEILLSFDTPSSLLRSIGTRRAP